MKFERFLKLLEMPDSTKTIMMIFNNTFLILLLISFLDLTGSVFTRDLRYSFYIWTFLAVLWPSIDFFSNSMQLYLNSKHDKKED